MTVDARSGFGAPRRARDARDIGARRDRRHPMTAVTARGDARGVGTATSRGRRATRRATTTTIRAAASAPARAVTREDCVAFVVSGCKPREAFRCGEENDATPGGAQSAEEGARANGGGRTGDDALSRRAGRRGTARADGAEDARGTRRRRARCARVRYRRAGGASARTDDETDDDAGSGRSTKSLGTTRRPSEGWIIQSCGTS